MFGALQSLTGGGGMGIGPSTNGDQKTDTDQHTEAGTVTNGGITMTQPFKFDIENPMHLIGAGVGLFVLSVVTLKAFK